MTAALAALLLCGLLIVAAQGSITVISSPSQLDRGAPATPSWARWCTDGQVRADRQQLAFCARVDGVVVASTHGPSAVEAHLAVISDFHLVIVRLPDGTATPSLGSRVVAVGPLVRARNGQREVQAFKLDRA